ncbi:hypothetical protein DFH09DRAFT_1080618 [Mycena vulgaris]|nr:hypothetical protein DFH09DRAFT_1080618 [Mycena vulgaris]
MSVRELEVTPYSLPELPLDICSYKVVLQYHAKLEAAALQRCAMDWSSPSIWTSFPPTIAPVLAVFRRFLASHLPSGFDSTGPFNLILTYCLKCGRQWQIYLEWLARSRHCGTEDHPAVDVHISGGGRHLARLLHQPRRPCSPTCEHLTQQQGFTSHIFRTPYGVLDPGTFSLRNSDHNFVLIVTPSGEAAWGLVLEYIPGQTLAAYGLAL